LLHIIGVVSSNWEKDNRQTATLKPVGADIITIYIIKTVERNRNTLRILPAPMTKVVLG